MTLLKSSTKNSDSESSMYAIVSVADSFSDKCGEPLHTVAYSWEREWPRECRYALFQSGITPFRAGISLHKKLVLAPLFIIMCHDNYQPTCSYGRQIKIIPSRIGHAQANINFVFNYNITTFSTTFISKLNITLHSKMSLMFINVRGSRNKDYVSWF